MEILVTGGWGSGTTAMAQTLSAAGLSFPGPYLRIRDERNPNSFENSHFRQAFLSAFSETALTVTSEEKLLSALSSFRDQMTR